MSLCVLMAGNPGDGYDVVGPFKQPTYAAEWADTWLDHVDWWVLPLKSTEQMEEENQNGSSS